VSTVYGLRLRSEDGTEVVEYYDSLAELGSGAIANLKGQEVPMLETFCLEDGVERQLTAPEKADFVDSME
jgi:hypothetical protein